MLDSWKMSGTILLALLIIIVGVNSVSFNDNDNDITGERRAAQNKSEYNNQDQEFMRLIRDVDNTLEKDRADIAFYFKKNDMYNLSKYSKIYKEDSEKYINKMKSLTLSSSHRVISEEYLKFLENAYLTGKYIEEGANTNNRTMINIGIDYNNKARNDITRVSDLIKQSG